MHNLKHTVSNRSRNGNLLEISLATEKIRDLT